MKFFSRLIPQIFIYGLLFSGVFSTEHEFTWVSLISSVYCLRAAKILLATAEHFSLYPLVAISSNKLRKARLYPRGCYSFTSVLLRTSIIWRFANFIFLILLLILLIFSWLFFVSSYHTYVVGFKILLKISRSILYSSIFFVVEST